MSLQLFKIAELWGMPEFGSLGGGAEGKYQGTVLQFIFVVLFCHCPGRSMKAVWGCVGKVRASHFRSPVLSL